LLQSVQCHRGELLSPVERSATVPGPNAIPVTGWSQVLLPGSRRL
jgi:hypothetical protein